MPALENIKDEALAQAYINHPTSKFNKTRAYLEVNPESKYDSARTTAPVVFAKPSIKSRLLELLEEDKRTSDKGCQEKLGDLMETAKDGVQLGAVQTVLKLKGHLSDGPLSLSQNNIANVNFNKIVIQNSCENNSGEENNISDKNILTENNQEDIS